MPSRSHDRSYPTLMPLLVGLMAMLVPATALAQGSLLDLVPRDAQLVIGTDHTRPDADTLSAAAHTLLGTLERHGPRVTQVPGLEVVTFVQRTLSFRLHKRARGVILAGAVPLSAVRKWAIRTQAKAFESGERQGRTWFRLGSNDYLGYISDGRLVRGAREAVWAIQDVAAGKRPSLRERPDLTAMEAEARRAHAPVWGIVWIPPATRKSLKRRGEVGLAAMERLTLNMTQNANILIRIRAHVGSDPERETLASTFETRLHEGDTGSLLWRATGLTALTRQVQIVRETRAVDLRMLVSVDRLALMASLGARVLETLL